MLLSICFPSRTRIWWLKCTKASFQLYLFLQLYFARWSQSQLCRLRLSARGVEGIQHALVCFWCVVRGDTAAEDGQIEDATAASKGLIDCFQVGSIHPYSCNCPGLVQERERERERERDRKKERERDRERERHCDSVCVCVCFCLRAHAKSEIDTWT